MKYKKLEFKLKTDDIDAFGNELERFVKGYLNDSSETDLHSISVGEWKAVDESSRSIDRLAMPANRDEARGWGITFVRENPKYTGIRGAPNLEVIVSISRIGGEYPLLLTISPYFPETQVFVLAFIERCKQLWDASLLTIDVGTTISPRGPNTRTQMRGDVFKRLKDKNPTWSYAKVAIEATGELGESVTSDTVRNTYHLLGWKWKRADRIR